MPYIPDVNIAMEVIDNWAEKNLEKPNKTMAEDKFKYCCEKWNAVDILKRYLRDHWYEAPSPDLVFVFIKQMERLKEGNDYFWTIVYKIAKEIFYYFI